jgi:exodeoxyribonuclease-3
VNGLRACATKGFAGWLRRSGAEIVGLQEVRARAEQLPRGLRAPRGWHTQRFDAEGRLQIARFGRLVVANVYFPKGSGSQRDNSRVPYKLAFYAALFQRLQRLRRGGLRVLVMGDFNTAHREIDLARPRDNRGNSGFLPEERAELDRWLAAGWIDTFRRFESGPGHYTWWSQRMGVRARNIGWRIDYVLASPAAMRHVRSAFMQPRVMGSDHCPVGVDVDPAIFD